MDDEEKPLNNSNPSAQNPKTLTTFVSSKISLWLFERVLKFEDYLGGKQICLLNIPSTLFNFFNHRLGPPSSLIIIISSPSLASSTPQMSDTLADLASWLPSEFFTHDHMDTKTPLFHNPHLFPSDFPYDFASSSSNESESDDDDISALTRRFTRSFSLQERLKTPYPLQKKRVFSGSPESTLNWTVSRPTQVRSSPPTPFVQTEEDALDLIYAAAGQVARMKMRMNNFTDDVFANRGLLVAPRPLGHGPPLSHHHPNCTIWRSGSHEFIKQQQFRYRATGDPNYGDVGRCGGGRPMGFRQSAWPPLPVENQRRQQPSNGLIAKPVVGGSGRGPTVLKKECAGTGVFLPRRYCTDPPESKKKPACSPAHLPARVVQSLNQSMDPNIPHAHPNIHGHGGVPNHSDYGTVVGGRNVMMLGRRSGGESAEVVLPQEWTY